jgi:hypothetical protein
MLKFANSSWRFDSPGRIPRGVADEFSRLIGQIAGPGDTQSILERFKSGFASAAGSESTMWSSSVSWARTDLETYMDQAGANAPLFIEAFYEACESLRSENVDVPDLALINRILVNHEAEYEVRPPNLILRGDTGEAVEVPAKPPSLDHEARETIQKSLAASEQFFSAGQYRQAVQEVLWLLETVSTAFQGIDTGTGYGTRQVLQQDRRGFAQS